jgi:polyhydroxyalkanoate synthase subunit PhaC
VFAPYFFWREWSDQAFGATLDFWKRSLALAQLQREDPPDVAQTPADVVYTENKLRLLRYRPAAVKRRHPIPLLIVPSLINRYYILDLKPERSLVEYLRDRGFDVWMMDWGTPGPEDRFVTFDDHVEGYLLNCVGEVLAATRQKKLSLLGYCIGGVLTTIFAALHGEAYVQNLIILASPLNFHDRGLLSLWARKEHFPVDLIIDTYGNMPAWLLQISFKWLRPTTDLRNVWGLWERLGQPERLDDFRALNHWVEDNVSVPGEAYRKFVKSCYQDNLLIQNKMQIKGRTVNLKDIRCPLLNITAKHDHVCPPQSAAALNDHVSSQDVTLLTLPGGHVGAIVGREATGGLWPQLSEWLAERSRN